VAQFRWQKPADSPEVVAIAQIRWHGTLVAAPSVTVAVGHDHAADRDAIPADSPTPTSRSLYLAVRFVRFSFLILIDRFAILYV
jgi:hypothetical protein